MGGGQGGSQALFSVTTDASGSTVLGAAAIDPQMLVKTAGGGQNFGDAVVLGANTTLTDVPPGSSSASITFQKTIDSDAPATPRTLTVNTRGATAFGGAVGNTAAAGQPDHRRPERVAGREDGLGGGTLNATTVDFKDDVVLAADTTVTGTTVSFEKTVNSNALATPRALTVNASGVTTFSGAIGNTAAVVSLTTDAQGGLPGEETVLGGGTLNATTVDFKDDVVLAADTTVTGTTVSFEKTINSDAPATPRALTVNAGGATAFGGAIGNTAVLASLTTDAQGGLPGEKTRLTDSTLNAATVDFKDDVVIGSSMTITGVTVTFEKTVNANRGNVALTVNASGVTTFEDQVGGGQGETQAPFSLTTDASGSTVLGTRRSIRRCS